MTTSCATPHFSHETVLLFETVDSLGDIEGKCVVDCTLGGGGHTALLLERVGKTGKVVAFDRDEAALQNARIRFENEISSGQLVVVDSPFSELKSALEDLGLWGAVAGVIADIGVSSHQFDTAERGFSFSHNGPLDMRMDPRVGISAADFLNEASQEEIADVIWKFGEEQKSRHIARLIVNKRATKPFQTTADLSSLIAGARLWKEKSKKNPATKTFQALRIYVNDELGELRALVDNGFECLMNGGVLAIISFHSLEDRIVKERFQDFSGKSKRQSLPRNIPLTEEQLEKLIEKKGTIVGPFPLEPTQEEIAVNPRSRSAKLRTIQKTSK